MGVWMYGCVGEQAPTPTPIHPYTHTALISPDRCGKPVPDLLGGVRHSAGLERAGLYLDLGQDERWAGHFEVTPEGSGQLVHSVGTKALAIASGFGDLLQGDFPADGGL